MNVASLFPLPQPRRTGTREWAELNNNIFLGCLHDCRYCYARKNALRRGRIDRPEKWTTMSPMLNELKRPAFKAGGRIMFPTQHDLLPEHLDTILEYLKKWLKVGNEILVVSKPHGKVIIPLCKELTAYQSQIVFRFTIGSLDDDVLRFWEPQAPTFGERWDCLRYACAKGYTTSVSCEPYLDGNVVALVEKLLPYVNDTIWIGLMNRVFDRVNTRDWSEHQKSYLRAVIRAQTDEAVRDLYTTLRGEPKVRWKDSIKEVIGLPGEDIG
jgi:DNA repair photolyase